MKIEKIKVDEIIPYEDNAKLHPERQIEQIRSSILEFGFNDPIAIDENNVVIEGNGRLMAIKDLGFKEVDCIRIEGLTEDQKRAYILVHNQLTMNTGFDIDILNKELEKIKGIDMKQFDFELNIDFDTDIDTGDGTQYSTKVEIPRNNILEFLQDLHKRDSRVCINYKWYEIKTQFDKCYANFSQIAINENSEVMYCCHKPYEIIGKLSDKDIWEKREQFQTNMSMCDVPCRLTAPNNFIQSLQDVPHDAAFI